MEGLQATFLDRIGINDLKVQNRMYNTHFFCNCLYANQKGPLIGDCNNSTIYFS